MDIDYLLLLQNFREGVLGGSLNVIAEKLSDFAVSPIPLMVAALIYWLNNKRAASFFFMNYGASKLLNELVKLFACVYRPWIRDDRVLPAGTSKTTATGYSFPSGHSNFSVSIYGSFAAWQWKKRKWLSIISVFLCLMTLFSRNFLGVHTPQDVIIGSCLSLLVLIINYQIYKRWVDNSKKPEIVLLVGLLIILTATVILTIKPYPVDYINNKMIVDPDKMIPDAFCAEGLFTGWIVAWYIDKKIIHYQVPKKINIKWIAISIVLVIPIYVWQKYAISPVASLIDSVFWVNFISWLFYTIQVLYIIAIVPAIYKKLDNKKVLNK